MRLIIDAPARTEDMLAAQRVVARLQRALATISDRAGHGWRQTEPQIDPHGNWTVDVTADDPAAVLATLASPVNGTPAH